MIHPVGMRTFDWVDPDRPNWTNDGPRPLAATLWYPAPAGTPVATFDIGPPQLAFCRMGEVAVDAPILDAGHGLPVVLLSHGTGGSAQGIGWLGVRLAAAGYVVLGPEHHGNSAMENFHAEGFAAGWERGRDLTVALDILLKQSGIASRLDPDRIHAAGFSMGGYSVTSLLGARLSEASYRRQLPVTPGPDGTGTREFPRIAGRIDEFLDRNPAFRASYGRLEADYRDSRIRSAFALAPAPSILSFTDESLGKINRPLSIFVGDADQVAPRETCARWLHQRIPGSRLTEVEGGVSHYVFLCEGLKTGRRFDPLLFVDPPGIDRRAIHDQAARLALEHFATS